jgi:hypothetical protein
MICISLTKKELATLCRVTSKTICIWLNYRYLDDLKKLGYTKNQKVLLPRQVEFLVGKLDIDTSDFILKK